MEEKVFTGKIIVEKILGRRHPDDGMDGQTDPVAMTHDQLQKNHQLAISRDGRRLGISLDENEKLFDGAILWQDGPVTVAVVLQEEDVLEVRPFGNEEWARVAFNIGNMHHAAYLYPTYIRIPYDPIVERMLESLGTPVIRKMAKLDGERANAPAGHSHGHSHVSQDHHSPDDQHHHSG